MPGVRRRKVAPRRNPATHYTARELAELRALEAAIEDGRIGPNSGTGADEIAASWTKPARRPRSRA
jgi:hypothetical protein